MKKYVLRGEVPEEASKRLAAYPALTRELLFARGIDSAEEAEKFLHPRYEEMADPYLLKDMDKAVERVIRAMGSGEKIAIYSDYDADGIPGAVVLHDFFKKIGYKNTVHYIPLRNEEGFGLNGEAIDSLAEDGVTLLITIDCGIADVEHVREAKKYNLDIIITDHHIPGGELPEAYAVINPKQSDCQYPEKMLCGSGVIFKLVQALVRRPEVSFPDGHEKWMLDMVGLATLSDMVPLLGENRTLAYYGLTVLRKSPRVGLLKLFSLLGIDKRNATEDDIAFMITPRINAASRMGIPLDAFKLLSTEDETEAAALAEHLNSKNDERKGVVGSMVREIKKKIAGRDEEMKKVLVLGNPEWKPSLLGLVASSFSDEHGRPVFLWGREGTNGGTVIKGSCRAGNGDSVVELMAKTAEKFPGTFLEYGGHRGAGGFSLLEEQVHTLEECLNDAFLELESVSSGACDTVVDKKLSLDDVNWNTYRQVEQFAPFGFENPKPLFLFENIEVAAVRQFGKEKNHLELKFKNSAGKDTASIAFFSGPEKFSVPVSVGSRVNLVATMEKSTFRNYPELRLRIVDIL